MISIRPAASARHRQSRLARQPAHLLVRPLLRPQAHGLRAAARHQRGPRAAGRRLRHPRPPRHGDHLLRPRRRARAQGQHRHRLGHPARRRAAHVGRHAASGTASSTTRRASRCISCRSGCCRSGEGLAPSYEQKTFADGEKRGRLRLVASRDGRDGSVVIHQDADIYASLLDEGEQVTHALRAGRKGWLQVARGAVDVNGQTLRAGDGAAVEERA